MVYFSSALKSCATAGTSVLLLVAGLGVAVGQADQQPGGPSVPADIGTVRYATNFSDTAVGSTPESYLIVEGSFAVAATARNKYLELPGAPLDTFRLLFGPTFNPKTDSRATVSARIQATSKGRRHPTFGVGLSGVSGFRLILAPVKKQLELYNGETLLSSKPIEWTSGAWTWFRCRAIQKDGRWTVEGKAWRDTTPEPASWLLSHPLDQAPIPGRASLWGTPYSGEPIRFDDLLVTD